MYKVHNLLVLRSGLQHLPFLPVHSAVGQPDTPGAHCQSAALPGEFVNEATDHGAGQEHAACTSRKCRKHIIIYIKIITTKILGRYTNLHKIIIILKLWSVVLKYARNTAPTKLDTFWAIYCDNNETYDQCSCCHFHNADVLVGTLFILLLLFGTAGNLKT